MEGVWRERKKKKGLRGVRSDMKMEKQYKDIRKRAHGVDEEGKGRDDIMDYINNRK